MEAVVTIVVAEPRCLSAVGVAHEEVMVPRSGGGVEVVYAATSGNAGRVGKSCFGSLLTDHIHVGAGLGGVDVAVGGAKGVVVSGLASLFARFCARQGCRHGVVCWRFQVSGTTSSIASGCWRRRETLFEIMEGLVSAAGLGCRFAFACCFSFCWDIC